MKQTEKDNLIAEITRRVTKSGIPINVRMGGNEEAAEWVAGLLNKAIEIDEPIGVKQGIDYDYCPNCGGIIGNSAYYCKTCGSYLREGGR